MSDCSLLGNMGEESNNSVECFRMLMRVYSISAEISNRATVMKMELCIEPLMTELVSNSDLLALLHCIQVSGEELLKQY